ncbi:MAG: 3-hydroxyacyl-CoA dehydrogenase/enoyl-CoA hydratase family protein [Myxococcales bacterium]|nr:MAG: 3-hydroxyacyl-CoA dehydrogenase/enoyl-CoA hydratase family protein [Myxococcales bacterium]
MAREIKKVAIIGAGIMGSGIAAHLANAGVPCVLLDIVPPNLTEAEKAKREKRNAFAQGAIDNLVKAKGNIQPLMNKRFAKYITIGNLEDDLELVKDCDWVLEVVVERLDIKRNLFDKLIKVVKPGTIVSSNTSGIAIKPMTEGYPNWFQENFCVTHFFNPVRYMRLLELVPGEKTKPEVLETLAEFGEGKLGKGIVYAKDTPNFVGNRIGVMAIMGVIQGMVEDDLTFEEVDAVTGQPMAHKSPTFKTADMVGLDTIGHIITNSYAQLTNDDAREILKVPDWLQHLIDKKAFGNKTKGGIFKKEGKAKLVLDRKTLQYREVQKPKADSLKRAKNTDDPRQRIKDMVYTDDKYGRFAWKLTARGSLYAVQRIGEICDDIVNIDNAMKWGYAWDLGPFEVWDAIGVKESVARMKKEGFKVPAVVDTMLAKSEGSWYVVREGKKFYWDVKATAYKPVPAKPQYFFLDLYKSAHEPIKKNASASLINIGDGVALVEFHSKMNAIDDDIIRMLLDAVDMVETSKDWRGLVVGNQGENFSVGANLAMIMMLAMGGDFGPIEMAVRGLQQANGRLHYSNKPVVAAPFGMVLGGGCEILLGADAVCAHAELYTGLVEIGAGLIPGGGGNKEMLIRYLENIPADMKLDRFPFVQRVFEQIAMAKVSLSAYEARDMKILRTTDRIVMNRDEQITEAKKMAIGLFEGGYTPPKKPDYLILPGIPGVATFETGLYNMKMGGYVTEYETKIAKKLANVLCGGEVEPNTPVDEDRLLDLEREAFMSLVGEPKTIERMQSLLSSGKPLRN